MYRKIIVGYDGTDQGRDALALGTALRASGGAVIAVCVYPEPGHGRTRQLEPVMARAAVETLAELREQADTDWLDLRAVPGQSAAHGLHRLSVQEDPDLVVVGSSHRGDAGRVLAGSVAERLLNGSPCPVALAPKGFHGQPEAPRVVGVAYDGSDEAAAALREAAALGFQFDATVRIVTVVPPLAAFSSGVFYPPQQGDEQIKADRREEFRRMLQNAAQQLPHELRATTLLVDGRPAEAIVEQAREGMHVLVMGSRSYGPIRRVMLGSTAIEVMRLAPCPVIVIPRGAATPSADAPTTSATTS